MDFLASKPLASAVFAAARYGVATIGLKLASAEWTAVALALILLGFLAATQSEVVLMRIVPLSELYLIVIALETLIALTYA